MGVKMKRFSGMEWAPAACLLAVLLAAGCGRGKNADRSSGAEADLSAASAIKTGELPQVTPGVYQGDLNPAKAAEITNAVAKLSLAEIPTKDLPKDPKVMMEINERIRQKSDALYAQFGTTMGDVMRYISDLSPQDREVYNSKLTELFLQDAKKKTTPGMQSK